MGLGKENNVPPPSYPGGPGTTGGNVYYMPQGSPGVYPNANGEVYVEQAQATADAERPSNFGNSFENAAIRRRFVRNVSLLVIFRHFNLTLNVG